MIARRCSFRGSLEPSTSWLTLSQTTCSVPRSMRDRHVPSVVSPTYAETESPQRFFPFLPPVESGFSNRIYSDGGRVTPSTRAYFLSPLKISPETGGHRLVLSLVMVVIYVKQNIAYKSAAFDATCHFGHEVREIIPSSKMSDERFAHGNRFTDCVVTNRITLLL